jgi:hypothetical protein
MFWFNSRPKWRRRFNTRSHIVQTETLELVQSHREMLSGLKLPNNASLWEQWEAIVTTASSGTAFTATSSSNLEQYCGILTQCAANMERDRVVRMWWCAQQSCVAKIAWHGCMTMPKSWPTVHHFGSSEKWRPLQQVVEWLPPLPKVVIVDVCGCTTGVM